MNSEIIVGMIGIFILLILFCTGIEIGFAMAVIGFVGFAYLVLLEGALAMVSTSTYRTFASYGLTVVPPDRVRDFLDPLPIGKMWGVGKVTQEALIHMGIRTFRDLSRFSVKALEKKFGKYGPRMHELSMGIDDREVVTHQEAKSIGREETYDEDILEIDVARKELL